MKRAAGMSCRCFKEIAVTPSISPRWRDINANTGGSVSTLQDIKVPDSAGGYGYRDSGASGSPTRNRFLYWRTSNDMFELVEESLDFTLLQNHVRFRFQDTPILGGITVHEQHGNVIILLVTVASVHRLVFPHPNKLQRFDPGFVMTGDVTLTSILADASMATVCNSKDMHMLSSVTGSPQQSVTAATCLSTDGEAMFAYVTHTGSIVIIKMPSHALQGVGVIQYELTRSTMIQRFWTGLVPAAIRGEQELSDCPYSLCMHPLGQDIHLFSICRDHKIRIWSSKTQECVSVCDMLEWTTYSDHPQRATVAASGHRIDKLVDHEAGTFRLVVYLAFTEQPLFCILEPMTDERQYHLDHICSVSAPSEELVDFCVTPHLLWSLWTDAEGELIARAATLQQDGQRGDNWVPVLLEPPLSADILIPSHKDPREVYMDEIFRPGRFTVQDIQKALTIYRRSLDSTFGDTVSITTLQEDVSAAVETEIQSVAREYELPEEEYYQLQLEQWAKFYSCCIQYHEVGSKSKGVFTDSNTGMVGIIRKGGLTYIRPCDPVEQLSLVPTDQLTPADLREMQTFGEDLSLCGDAVHLLECLSLISTQLTEEMAATFEQELYQSQGPEVIGQQILEELISLPRPADQPKLTKQLESHIQMVRRLPDALLKLQCLLELTLDQSEPLNIEDSSVEAGSQLTCSRLFSGEVAMGILSVCVRQATETRLAVARNLLIVQLFVLHLKDKCGISPKTAEYVMSDSVPQTCLLIRSYYTLLWLTATIIAPIPANSIEFNLRQLAALDINDPAAVTVTPQQGQQNKTLADLFIQGVGGRNARSILAQARGVSEEPGKSWALSLQPLVTIIAQLLWPYSPSFVLAEMLMGQCQYLHLQDYVRLLADWCLWNAASRAFLLGQCYLNFNEPYKAVESFIDGEKGVSTDEFLSRKLLQSEETDTHRLEVLYYLKVIKLYEQFSIPDLTVTLADTAISKADDDDPNLPTLWSKVFKYQLEMGHNDEAYSAMISNPDASRRTDCLRQFLVVLCERGELQTLVQYQYIDLHDEVVSILESRARSVDLATHNYYDLLYSFHIYRGNYRKAGSVMYEYGRRLGQELPSLKGFQRQAKCYLSALNALRLVNPKYAWIIKPLANTRQRLESEGTSPKHTWSGEEKTMYCQKVELLEVKDIEKEYLLVNSRLRLLQRDPDPAHITGPTNGPVEMVGLLVNVGLYDQAVAVSQAFGLSISPVVEGLSMRCLQLANNSFYHMQGDNDYTSSAWDWLGENETKTSYSVKETTSSADQAWRLLRHYLQQYDDVNGQFHRSVAIKLLSQGFTLPSWFVASYKRLNAAELLRLLIDFDLLEDAGHLALEYIDAVRDVTRGQDREVFKLEGLLQPLPQSVWLPYTCIDQLLIALKDGQSDHVYKKISEELKSKMSMYQQHVSSLRDNFHTMVN